MLPRPTNIVALLGLCMAGVLHASAPAPSKPDATAIKPGDTVVVVRDKVRFSLGSKLLAELAKGTEFRVTSVNGDWVGGVIDIAGKQEKGWVKSADLDLKPVPASAPVPPAPAGAAEKTTPGKTDDVAKMVFGMEMPEAKKHIQENLLRKPSDDKEAIQWVVQAAHLVLNGRIYFLRGHDGKERDEAGNVRQDVNAVTFTQAVKNVTREKLAMIRDLVGAGTGEHDGKDWDAGAFCALMGASRAFIQTKDQFNSRAFNAALENLEKAKVDKAVALIGFSSDVPGKVAATVHLLSACARFLDASGNFDSAQFRSQFNALPAKQLAGNDQESRIKAFHDLLRPGLASRPTGSLPSPAVRQKPDRPALSERQHYLRRADSLPREALAEYVKATGSDPGNAFLKLPGVDELWTADDKFDHVAFKRWMATVPRKRKPGEPSR